MTNQQRQPAGVPTGGQFAGTVRDEATVQLDEHLRQRHQDQAVDALVAQFGGDATAAMLALTRRAGIAVHYLDRQGLETDFRPLTEDEWERLKPNLEKYDEWLDNSGASESISYFRGRLLDEAGIAYETCRHCKAGIDDGDGYDGYCGTCADMVEAHEDGEHEGGDSAHNCPLCSPSD